MPATLTSLRIRNLALVEDLEWRLGPGFTAVTGETGSGKSIILGALKLLVGERADKSLIRTGADSCTVEAVFEFASEKEAAALNAWLEEQGVEPCEGTGLLIKRTFAHTGSNRQFINASPTTLSVLKALGNTLVDLHGPHDHQSLLSVDKQRELLDAYAGAVTLCRDYQNHYRRWNELVAEHAELSSSEAALEREIDLLRHQVNEIESANLREDEEAELLARYQVAGNSRRLIEVANQIVQRMAESDDAILNGLGEITRALRELEKLDPSMGELVTRHLAALNELEDLCATVQQYAEKLDLDPEQLAQMEERVTLLETLKRKYGPEIPDVIAFGQKAAERLRKIESRGDELERLAREIEAERCKVMEVGEALRARRKAAAPKLAREVAGQLRDLGFKKSEFEVAIQPAEKPGPHGLDHVEFLFAPNPGEPAKPPARTTLYSTP
ncbi:AAA family ATPase [uncultured Pigmentiphaga sp.]|uniref:DNA repair protein RecN n=1 Tax=uncultured Pigmentiphaga sp. TaxID=340361 RepID=UPI002610269A|nr:AAA family ATPase [uncultured Pigmentiphaga sp.]